MKSLLPLALAALFVVPPLASETGTGRPPEQVADESANIHFSLTMLDTDASGNAVEQTVETLLVSEREVRTRTGWRVPFPAVSVPATDGQDVPVTSYRYQDVGLALSLRGRALGHDRVRASGQVEISGVDRHDAALAARAPAPQIGTFSHKFEATLLDGKPTTLVSVPKPDGGSVELTLTASIEHR